MSGRASTTALCLRWQRIGLLAGAIAVFVPALLAFQGARDVVGTVGARTSAAILDVTAAQDALARADVAAVASFAGGGVELAGPGQDHQAQIAVASQDLARAAGEQVTGDEGSRALQLVGGLLVEYTGLIEHADAELAQHHDLLGVADLWSATRLLHQDEGILAKLDQLRAAQQDALHRQLSTGWLDRAAALWWALPGLALLALLVVTQAFLRRRFGRAVNPALLLATALVVALLGVASLTLVVRSRLDATSATVASVVLARQTRTSTVDATGRWRLAQLLSPQCAAGCGEVVTAFVRDNSGGPARQVEPSQNTTETQEVAMSLTAAGRNTNLEFLIYAASGAVALLVLVGMQPRFDEYRHRAR
ncbi:hypothetical protein F0L68_31995 [Solihabitans fulvus]|uniref:Uncharacterized protein n=1 Tax=Solihabitans fulvus TaxID=1892852 RepID=A0A5B2WSI4_9PSEU|nr:hypothetical protein [Solihabitans fulvus]KAA2253894.1 hypothetical protein F0L68_31995 [Solihabitans fulvus]